MQRRANSPIVNIPDDLVERFEKVGYKQAGAAKANKTDVPSKDWKIYELKAYAEKLGIDASKERSKDGVLALIAAQG